MALDGRSVSPSMVPEGDKGVAGGNGGDWHFPNEGSLVCPPGKSNFFNHLASLTWDSLRPLALRKLAVVAVVTVF